jgi:VWFA-related protein
VKDLAKEGFVRKQDGALQTVSYFSRESNLPLTIGLLVDTSRSQTEVLESERRARETFLRRVPREGADQTFVIQFDEEVEVLQGPTSSPAELEAALKRLSIPDRRRRCHFSAVQEGSENYDGKERGRKA